MNQNNAEDAGGSFVLKNFKILLVEDNLILNEMLTDFFVNSGAKVISVISAAEALEAIRSQRPVILLSNIVLPDEDGYSLIRKIRSLSPEQGGTTPAIALTASASETNRRRILEAGFQTYLSKPFEPAKLVDLIITLIQH